MSKKRTADEARIDQSKGEVALKYPQLQPRTKRVPLDDVKKWERLPDATQETVNGLFKAAERPVLMKYRDGKSRVEAQGAVSTILAKLGKSITKLPFPRNTRDNHFDYEAMLDENRTLEAELTPGLHSIALLKMEINKEEDMLRADRERLRQLEKNAKAEMTKWKHRSRKVHPLLEQTTKSTSVGDDAAEIGLVSTRSHDRLSSDVSLFVAGNAYHN
ncbi:MAG: hypothetical protein M1825_001130 [Sarcosagium campestre]|nr:MAG: hypothetical protein M1825_001130 [Sarcosagium campestre]